MQAALSKLQWKKQCKAFGLTEAFKKSSPATSSFFTFSFIFSIKQNQHGRNVTLIHLDMIATVLSNCSRHYNVLNFGLYKDMKLN